MKTVTEIGRNLKATEIRQRKRHIISYLKSVGVLYIEGKEVNETMSVRELEPIYIKKKNKEGRALSE